MKKVFVFLFIPGIVACKKNGADSAHHILAASYSEVSIKTGQEITIYDSTGADPIDSLFFFDPPTNRLYEWTIKPDDGSVSPGGKYQNGVGDFLFRHAGKYALSAVIFDSATHRRIDATPSIVITVSSDTLQRAQAFDPGDSLFLSYSEISRGTSPALIWGMESAKEYYYHAPSAGFVITGSADPQTYSLFFSDSISLYTYPFAHQTGTKAKVGGIFGMIGQPGTSRQFNITWLGKTYSGRLDYNNEGKVTVDWHNGVVSIRRN